MISVCMATYNGGKYVKEQIESILLQLSTGDELIISDDGSKDDTCSIIKTFNDSRIRLVHNNANHGFVRNFENALRYVKGDYIFFSDQDDIWLSNKVSVVLNHLQTCDLIVHDADIVDAALVSLGKTYYSTLHQSDGFLMNFYKTRFLGCCMAFNRKVLEVSTPFPKYIEGHDYWIGSYAQLKCKVKFIPDILLLYRRHGENVSPSSERSNNSLFYKLVVKRMGIIYSIISKTLKEK